MVNLDESVSHGRVILKRREEFRMCVPCVESPQTQHSCGILMIGVMLWTADGG